MWHSARAAIDVGLQPEIVGPFAAVTDEGRLVVADAGSPTSALRGREESHAVLQSEHQGDVIDDGGHILAFS